MLASLISFHIKLRKGYNKKNQFFLLLRLDPPAPLSSLELHKNVHKKNIRKKNYLPLLNKKKPQEKYKKILIKN